MSEDAPTRFRSVKDLPSAHLLGSGTPMCAGCGGLLALSEIQGKRLAILFVTIVENDLGAVTTRRGNFRCRCIFRHRHQNSDTRFASSQGHSLRVITGRKSHDTLLPLGGRQRLNLVGCAANLERAGALQVFAFEKDFLA